MMTNDDERGEGGKKCPKFDDVICERPHIRIKTCAISVNRRLGNHVISYKSKKLIYLCNR